MDLLFRSRFSFLFVFLIACMPMVYAADQERLVNDAYALLNEKLGGGVVDENSEPWEILGVAQNATSQQVNQALKRLKIRLHPDRNPENRDAATHAFKLVGLANDRYDHERGQWRNEVNPNVFNFYWGGQRFYNQYDRGFYGHYDHYGYYGAGQERSYQTYYPNDQTDDIVLAGICVFGIPVAVVGGYYLIKGLISALEPQEEKDKRKALIEQLRYFGQQDLIWARQNAGRGDLRPSKISTLDLSSAKIKDPESLAAAVKRFMTFYQGVAMGTSSTRHLERAYVQLQKVLSEIE